MNKIKDIFKKSLSTKDNNTLEKSSRRDFFKNTAALSVSAIAASSVLGQVKAFADDKAIIDEAPWGQKLGDMVTDHPYGLPSPYEHNNIRRTMDLLSSGDMHASISMCPIHESEGIITPNGLFFTRDHGGTAQVDPNEWRLMIHGKVKKKIVLTLDELKRYPSETRTYFIECPANGSPEWRAPQLNNLRNLKHIDKSNLKINGAQMDMLAVKGNPGYDPKYDY